MNQKITALTFQKKNRQRVNVYLDGEFAFGISHILAAWLKVGQEINAEKISELQQEDAREVAFQSALRYLNYKPRSEEQVREHLRQRQTPEEVVDLVVSRLKDNGMLDDVRFARNWVEQSQEHRPRSRRAIAFELKRKGIAPDVIKESLQKVNEAELAYQAAARQSKKLAGLGWADFRLKLTRFLVQQGFDYEYIPGTITRLWADVQTINGEEEGPL